MLNDGASEGGLAFIPVAGPFATVAAHKSANSGGVSFPITYIADMYLITTGVLQTTGGILLGFAYGAPKKVLVPIDSGITLRPGPVMGNGRMGFGLTGTF